MSLPTALPGSPSACIRADIVEGHLATASEIEAALLPVVGEVSGSTGCPCALLLPQLGTPHNSERGLSKKLNTSTLHLGIIHET